MVSAHAVRCDVTDQKPRCAEQRQRDGTPSTTRAGPREVPPAVHIAAQYSAGISSKGTAIVQHHRHAAHGIRQGLYCTSGMQHKQRYMQKYWHAAPLVAHAGEWQPCQTPQIQINVPEQRKEEDAHQLPPHSRVLRLHKTTGKAVPLSVALPPVSILAVRCDMHRH